MLYQLSYYRIASANVSIYFSPAIVMPKIFEKRSYIYAYPCGHPEILLMISRKAGKTLLLPLAIVLSSRYI